MDIFLRSKHFNQYFLSADGFQGLSKAGLALKNLPKKTHPKKTKKPPTKNVFFFDFLGFF
jgi:hypothetical protein